jgi:DeoR/GlpR family transcriptional regulator of sugar metabolism
MKLFERMNGSRDLYLEERRQQVLTRIQEAGRISVAELSQAFGVSEVTIRLDLQALADQQLIVRTHGGAVPADAGLSERTLALRLQQQVQEKSRIGEAGAAMVANGDAVALDSSSTALAVAQHLKARRHLTVVTNSLAVAQEMLTSPGVNVVMSGGRLRRDMASLVGTDGLSVLHKFNIRLGFFGAHGITIEDGLTDVSDEEAEVKRGLVGMCRQVIAVLDATKWGKVGLVSFAPIERVDVVITDSHAPANLVAQVRALNKNIVRV